MKNELLSAVAIVGMLAAPMLAHAQGSPAYIATGSSKAQPITTIASLTYFPEQFGAKCDGVTDDTTAINGALATSGGIRLAVRAGAVCFSATGITVPPGSTLAGMSFEPGNPTAGSRIMCAPNVNCVTVGNGTLGTGRIENLVVETNNTATPTGGSCIYIDGGFNVTLERVMVWDCYDGYYWQSTNSLTGKTAAGLGGKMRETYSGKIADAHVVADGWPELRIDQSRFGVNGVGDLPAVAYVRIMGGNTANPAGGGPDTIYLVNDQLNQGAVAASYGVQFSSCSGWTTAPRDIVIDDVHVEAVSTADITSDSTCTRVLYLHIANSQFPNVGIGFWALNAATALSNATMTGNFINSATFNLSNPINSDSFIGNYIGGSVSIAPSVQVNDLVMDGNVIGNTVTLTSPSNNSTMDFSGNTTQGITVSGPWSQLNIQGGDIRSGTLTNTATGNVNIIVPGYAMNLGLNSIDGMLAINGPALDGEPGQFATIGNNAGAGVTSSRFNGTGSEGATFVSQDTNATTYGQHGALAEGDTVGSWAINGDDGTSFTIRVGEIFATVDGPVSTGVIPGRMSLQTQNSSGTLLEALRLDSSQNAWFRGSLNAFGGTLELNGAAGDASKMTMTAPATGGAARTLAARSLDLVDVLDFGADPTGATDSTAAFNNACAVSVATYHTGVFVPGGSYALSGQWTCGTTLVPQSVIGIPGQSHIAVGANFSTSAIGVLVMIGPNQTGGEVTGLTFDFEQGTSITTRGSFQPLGTCTNSPTIGCQYPWAINATGVNRERIFNNRINSAWNGVLLNPTLSTNGGLWFQNNEIGAINVGASVENNADVAWITHDDFWPFGFSATTRTNVYQDGTTEALSLSRSDDAHVDIFTFAGSVVLNAASSADATGWTWGDLRLDLDTGATLIVNQAGGTDTLIHGGYQSGLPPNGKCAYNFAFGGEVNVTDVERIGNQSGYSAICLGASHTGVLVVNNSNLFSSAGYDAIVASNTSGGALRLTNNRFSGTAGTSDCVVQLGSTDVLTFVGNTIVSSHAQPAICGLTDNAQNVTSANVWNGWQAPYPGALGTYQGVSQTLNVAGAATIESGATTSLVVSTTADTVYFVNSESSSPGASFLFENGSGGILGAFQQGSTAAQADYLQMNSAASGAAVRLLAVGSDTNVPIIFQAKGSSNLVFDNPAQLEVATVSTLPSCSAAYAHALMSVSDAVSPTYNGTLTGGGSIEVPVMCNGTVWLAH